jgi:parallel beta-helix repeat protein
VNPSKKIILTLLVSLTAMVVAFFLLAILNTQAAMLTVSAACNSRPGARPSVSGSPLCATADFTYPLTIPLTVRDTFGPRLLQPGGYTRYDFHRGIDWPAPIGWPASQQITVHAVTTGTVRGVEKDWVSGTGSGNFVLLAHERLGCETRYNHLLTVTVSEGDQVAPGQIIGAMGDTGATYSHLHFEVRQGLTVTQRAAIHPLGTPFLPWTNHATPTVVLRGVYTDATGLTALVEASSPYTEPDVTSVSVAVSGTVTDSRTIDYVELNAGTPVVADLDDPLVHDVCIIPDDLNVTNGYRVTMAFRRLNHGPAATVTARATDVDGWSSTATTSLIGGLEVAPPVQIARGVPGYTVTFVYTLTNHMGTTGTFTLTHLSAQGWRAAVAPAACTLAHAESVTVTVVVTLNTGQFGPPDCGLLLAEASSGTQRAAAGFYRIYRDAYVSPTGSDVTGTGSMTEPFATISHAISRTDDGGTIYVAQGTYTENLRLDKTVDLLGGYPLNWGPPTLAAYSTTVDGGGNDTVLEIDGDYGPLIEGFTFLNGYRHGGAGGGVRLVGGAAPTLRFNWILSNAADLSGGGIYVSAASCLTSTIVGNVISGNTSSSTTGGGGGIYVNNCPALIQDNVIGGNRATANDGGGIYLTGDTTAQVLGNDILGNEAAGDGGGVLVRSSSVYLANNAIRHNTAGNNGHGIRVAGSSAPRIYNNTLVANHPTSGVGLYISTGSTPAVVNNIVATHAVGIHCSSPVTISFSILSNTVDLDGSCIDHHNIYTDPRLIDEIHLAPGSPAIDAGQPDSYVPSTDFDGQPRPTDGNCDGIKAVDIGADEYYGCVYLPIVLKNFPASGFEYDVSGCLGRPGIQEDDTIEIFVEGYDIVMHHHNAVYNCCAAIVVDLIDERPLLKLIERETYPEGYPPCPCMCTYDIRARIPNLPPGTYRVEVWNEGQSHCYGWAEVTVP